MNKTREMFEATHKRFSDAHACDHWEADMALHESDYDGEEDPDVGGYCIAGDNCMCRPYQRARCIDWKQQA